MAKQTYNDRAYASFKENVAGALVGKEGYIVELAPGTGNIQLYTATAGRPPLGVIFERLEGDNNYSVRLFGCAGSVRCIASGNIPANGQVQAVNGGTVQTVATGNAAIGFLMDGVAHVANDVVEVRDCQQLAY